MQKKILVTGGDGRFAKILRKNNKKLDLFFASKNQCNILNLNSITKIVKKVKSITEREIFAKVPSVKKKLWRGEFWSDGYFVSTVGEHANEEVIRQYIKNQGRDGKYKQLHKEEMSDSQLSLF